MNFHVHPLSAVAGEVIDPFAKVGDAFAALAGWNVLEASPGLRRRTSGVVVTKVSGPYRDASPGFNTDPYALAAIDGADLGIALAANGAQMKTPNLGRRC